MSNSKRFEGFTLIEVMIVVAIIGLLAAIAVPSYTQYIQRSHRAEARNVLHVVSQRLEQNYTLSGRYDQNQQGGAINNDWITNAGFGAVPGGGAARYNITFVENFPTQAAFRLQAVPAGAQTTDVCGILLINQQNIRGAVGVLDNRAQTTLDCWGR
jgi:type IV pilus assembly protein PilE